MKQTPSSLVENSLDRALQYELPKVSNLSEWPVDWGKAQCGPPNPVARDNHATMWMTCNFAESVFQDLSDFFRMAHAKLRVEVERISDDRVLIKNPEGQVLLDGVMHTGEYEANVGRHSVNGDIVLSFFMTKSNDKSVPKRLSELKLALEMKRRMIFLQNLKSNIQDAVAARCLLAYKDMSKDPSIGPTIEMIAVHKEYRGRGLLEELWFWVKRFIEDNIALESLNIEASPRSIQIKATKLTNTEIEQDETGLIVTDKNFFYEWAGFSIRRQIDPMPVEARFQTPIDEEAVLYITLPSKQEVKERDETRFHDGETNEFKEWIRIKGSRYCWACLSIGKGLLRCSRCKLAQYCNSTCQKKHFKYHKHWCGKTREQIQDQLTQIRSNLP